jgi:hypothetical protein
VFTNVIEKFAAYTLKIEAAGSSEMFVTTYKAI